MTVRHALVCAPRIPEFDRESGSRRINDFIGYLRDAGWAVSFVSKQAPDGERYVRVLQQRGVAVYHGFDSRVEQLIGAVCPDLALLAFWNVAEQLLPVVRRLAPATPILVESVDLHFLRNSRGTFDQQGNRDSLQLLNENFAFGMLRELNVYAAADGVLAVSQKEADLINDLMNDRGLAHVVPHADDIALSPVPFAQRRGILFLGNFRHAPNVSAVEYFCRDIIPRVGPSLLAEHPVLIVGNGLYEAVRGYCQDLAHVKMVGWVPSVLPYLNQARVTVLPLLFGAGTKGKLVQALMAGTPTVSTTIGIEGLELQDGENVLVADNPEAFARAIERLLTDEDLWQRLAHEGKAHIDRLNGSELSRQRFLEAINCVRGRPLKPPPPVGFGSIRQPQLDKYKQLIRKVHAAVRSTVPAGARILVVSKGDDRLLAVDGLLAAHFPQADGGGYAGYHPGSGAEALSHITVLQARGSEYLVFPATSFWWLDHYSELREHLEARCQCLHNDSDCRIYWLGQVPLATNNGASKTTGKPRTPAEIGNRFVSATHDVPEIAQREGPLAPVPIESQSIGAEFLARVRPVIPARALARHSNGSPRGKRILVYGVYLANQPNTADHVVAALRCTQRHEVTQRWTALFGEPPTSRVASVTVGKLLEKTPKFQILNDLLAAEDLGNYDYVLMTDDDIVVPEGFLDAFIGLQEDLAFAIAQPARTPNSYIDHPIVEQQQGVLARRTMFVEVGPVVSFHRSCYDLVFPFDLTSPMGWGYENVWSRRLAERGLKMGIIDAVPVDHSLRKPVENYSWAEANAQRKLLLARQPHYPLDQCLRVLEVAAFPDADQGVTHG
jgi:glycosyltransferase involved in cell wall biosynthesis